MSDVPKIDWKKLAKLDATARKALITAVAQAAYQEQTDGPESKERTAAGNLALRCAAELRNEERHVTDEKIAEAKKLLEDLERERAQQRGSRPERISVPTDSSGPDPVH